MKILRNIGAELKKCVSYIKKDVYHNMQYQVTTMYQTRENGLCPNLPGHAQILKGSISGEPL